MAVRQSTPLRRVSAQHPASVAPPSYGYVNLVGANGATVDPKYLQWARTYGAPPPRGNVTLSVQPIGRGGGNASRDSTTGQVTVNLDAAANRFDLAHELGHAFDDTVMTPAARARYLAIMGQNRPWGDQGAAHSGYPNPPREQFAEAYRIVSTHQKALANRKAWVRYKDGYSTGSGYDLNLTYNRAKAVQRLLGDAAAGKYGAAAV